MLGVGLINLVLSLFVHWTVLKGFPNSGDEYSYLLGAELLAVGAELGISWTLARWGQEDIFPAK